MYAVQSKPIFIGIFISHSWAYSDHYDKLSEWLFDEHWSHQTRRVIFADYSVPKSDPIHSARTERELYSAIFAKIAISDVVLIPTGMYSTYSKWIGKEILAAKSLRKPILAVNPWGQERKSSLVLKCANLPVGWNKQSIADGTWRLFLHG